MVLLARGGDGGIHAGGMSDIAPVSADMGIMDPEVSVLHIMRMITVVTVFPHILSLFIRLFRRMP